MSQIYKGLRFYLLVNPIGNHLLSHDQHLKRLKAEAYQTLNIFLTFLNFWITLLTLLIGVISFLGSKNLKKEIIAELNKKGLTEKEIYLLQKLAGISKK